MPSLIMKIPLEDAVVEEQVVPGGITGCSEHLDFASERAACAESFAHFLPHWKFKSREARVVMTFANLWPGQRRAVEQMERHNWLYLLKAGKLGFTELECAYDGWVALFKPNSRVHILSLNLTSAKELLQWVRFGVLHLPPWLGLPLTSERGNDTAQGFALYGGVDDERKVLSYPAVKNAAIDQTATHTHVDELARMKWPNETWSAVESTVAPGGSVHIVTRGAGDSNATAEIWDKAMTGEIPMHPHFEPWDARPRAPELEEGQTLPEGVDPNEVFYQQHAGSMLSHELNWFLPTTAEDALRGSSESQFVPEATWAACYDATLLPLMPGDRTPLVVGVDAGVTNDYFAVVAVSRHPDRKDDPAVRAVKVWKPENGQEIDFDEVERWLRILCLGGCVGSGDGKPGHPNKTHQILSAEPGCAACAEGVRIPAHNVAQIAYDTYQLVNMMQNLRRDDVVWCNRFDQGALRQEADGNLRSMIVWRRLAHGNDPYLNEGIKNANAKTSPNEDTKLRLVKRHPKAKIDAAVACSMAVFECQRLIMENAA